LEYEADEWRDFYVNFFNELSWDVVRTCCLVRFQILEKILYSFCVDGLTPCSVKMKPLQTTKNSSTSSNLPSVKEQTLLHLSEKDFCWDIAVHNIEAARFEVVPQGVDVGGVGMCG
jgi:hypothetical protein